MASCSAGRLLGTPLPGVLSRFLAAFDRSVHIRSCRLGATLSNTIAIYSPLAGSAMTPIVRSSLVLLLAVSTVSSDMATAFSHLRTTQRHLQTYTQYNEYFQQMLDAVNVERAKAGLSALCTNSKLAEAAKRHSEDMAANDFMAHEGSDGSTLSQRITDAQYEWDAVAENVAAGQEDVAAVMKSWMNSEGHRTNILGADYTMLGTAYAFKAQTTYKHYWTQDFGAGETEACDGGSSNSSQTAYDAPKQDVAGEASAPQETTYTVAPATTAAPSTTAPPAGTETPATMAPGATTSTFAAGLSVITEAEASAAAKSTRCKAKK